MTINEKGTVLVTGGSRGIGRAICLRAAAEGYNVAVNYLNSEDAANALVDEIEQAGGRASALPGDVSQELDVLSLFEVVKEMGPLAAVVNNAGILETQMPLVEMSVGRIDRVFATNVRGTFLCCREAVRVMSTKHGGNGGAIVNLSSAASRLGSPNEYIDYAASKGAVDSLTLGLAKEVGDAGIRVNAVRPGLIETDIHASGGDPKRAARLGKKVPMGRPGTADEVANLVIWLVSGDASYCNGALIDVAGGR